MKNWEVEITCFKGSHLNIWDSPGRKLLDLRNGCLPGSGIKIVGGRIIFLQANFE